MKDLTPAIIMELIAIISARFADMVDGTLTSLILMMISVLFIGGGALLFMNVVRGK